LVFSRKAEYEVLPGHTITLDSEDLERVSSRTWEMYPGEHMNTAQFYTDLGTPGRPAFQLLQGFILGVKPNVFVEQIIKGDDYRRKNLREYNAPVR
jgi:hypothetical protein